MNRNINISHQERIRVCVCVCYEGTEIAADLIASGSVWLFIVQKLTVCDRNGKSS